MKQKKGVHHYFLWGCAAILFFFGVHAFFVRTPGRLESIASSLVYPMYLLQTACTQPFKNYSSAKKDRVKLQQELTELHKKHAELQDDFVELQADKLFLEDTHELRKFSKRYDPENLLLARVIDVISNNNEQHLLINQGTIHGVYKDLPVVHQKNIVGKVTHSYPNYSIVTTIFDTHCKIAARCTKTKTKGIVQGTNSTDSLLLKHVDHLAKLKVGDTVLSAGQGIIFPEGFALGTIRSFTQDEFSFHVEVEPSISINEITYCHVLMKSDL